MKTLKMEGNGFAAAKSALTSELNNAGKVLATKAKSVLEAAIKEIKADLRKSDVRANMTTSFDGQLTCTASYYLENFQVPFETKVEVKGGKMHFVQHEVVAKLMEAFEAAKAAPRQETVSATKKMDVDFTKVEAVRTDGLVRFTTPELPGWRLLCSVDELKDTKTPAANRVMASLAGYCLTQLHREASFKQAEFKMPMIQASVTKRPSNDLPAVLSAKAEPVTPEPAKPLTAAQAPMTSPTYTANQSQHIAAENRRGFERNVMVMATPYIEAYVRQTLRGGNPKITNSDLSGVTQARNGSPAGEAVVAVQFYGRFNRESVNLKVPFDANGRVDIKAIDRTKADLVAEEDRKKHLQLKSEEEAKRTFEEFVAAEKAKKEKQEKLGVKAGAGSYGSNFYQRGPSMLIPILKAALPEEVSKPGKHLMVDGFIYEVEATDHNAPSVEKSSFWMLRLKPELSANDADHKVVYAGAREIIKAM